MCRGGEAGGDHGQVVVASGEGDQVVGGVEGAVAAEQLRVLAAEAQGGAGDLELQGVVAGERHRGAGGGGGRGRAARFVSLGRCRGAGGGWGAGGAGGGFGPGGGGELGDQVLQLG